MTGPQALVLLLLLLPVLLGWAGGHPVPRTKSFHKLLLISFDGFRWDYDQDVDTPNMDRLAQEGVKAKYLTPPFVTMTSPSHFTTISGKLCPAARPLCRQKPGVRRSLKQRAASLAPLGKLRQPMRPGITSLEEVLA